MESIDKLISAAQKVVDMHNRNMLAGPNDSMCINNLQDAVDEVMVELKETP